TLLASYTLFSFHHPATTAISTLSLHDALPILRAKQPLVPGADEKIGAQLPHVHGHCPATLAHIEKQESALLVARPSDARRIQQRAVVVAHQAHGNDARSWRHRPNQIVDRNEIGRASCRERVSKVVA